MSLDGTKRQKSRQLELPLEDRGETPKAERSDEVSAAAGVDPILSNAGGFRA